MTLEKFKETSMDRLLKRQAADVYNIQIFEKNNQASLVA